MPRRRSTKNAENRRFFREPPMERELSVEKAILGAVKPAEVTA